MQSSKNDHRVTNKHTREAAVENKMADRRRLDPLQRNLMRSRCTYCCVMLNWDMQNLCAYNNEPTREHIYMSKCNQLVYI